MALIDPRATHRSVGVKLCSGTFETPLLLGSCVSSSFSAGIIETRRRINRNRSTACRSEVLILFGGLAGIFHAMDAEWPVPSQCLDDGKCHAEAGPDSTIPELLGNAFRSAHPTKHNVFAQQQLAAGERQRLLANSRSGGICVPRVSWKLPADTADNAEHLFLDTAEVRLNITTINSLAAGLVQLRLEFLVPPGPTTEVLVSPSHTAAPNTSGSLAASWLRGSTKANCDGLQLKTEASATSASFTLAPSSEMRRLEVSCVTFAFPTYEGHVAALSAGIPRCKRQPKFAVNCFVNCDSEVQSIYGYTHTLTPGPASSCHTVAQAVGSQPEWLTDAEDDTSYFGVCVATNLSAAHALQLWSGASHGRGEQEMARYLMADGSVPSAPYSDLLAHPFRVPAHVAVIMDGNGRWAKHRGLSRSAGHSAGVDAIHRVIRACRRMQVQYLTLYAFSAQNWDRPAAEVTHLMGLLEHFVFNDCQQLVQNGVRLLTVGDIERLPSACRDGLSSLSEQSAKNTDLTLVLALSYGGREEVASAAALAMEDALQGKLAPQDLRNQPSLFADYLPLAAYGVPDPDLLIRTSGEMRVSNFLLWQIAYSELYVTAALWPDFTEKHLATAFAEYSRRERRFGLTGDQVGQQGGGQAPTVPTASFEAILPVASDCFNAAGTDISVAGCKCSSAASAAASLDEVWAATGRPLMQPDADTSTSQWLSLCWWGIIWAVLVACIRLCALVAPMVDFPAPPPLPACLTPPCGPGSALKRWQQPNTLQLSAQAAVQSGAVWFSHWLSMSVRRCLSSVGCLAAGCLLGFWLAQ